FMNRIDKTVVFKTLRPEQLREILEIELGMVTQRILKACSGEEFLFYCTQRVKDFLLDQGTDAKYGARHLKRVIEKNVVLPLANLASTAQIGLGDCVRIDVGVKGRFTFTKDEREEPRALRQEHHVRNTMTEPLAVCAAG
ncbi:MAG TPA: hypothetical protein VG498_11865, partial [Terriglobales bacterium]|nr:hypothetical protein [Terriglobales bacterium]